jgi:hypothetical protein
MTALAEFMDGSSEDLFAHPRFAKEENRRRHRGDLFSVPQSMTQRP